MPNSDGRSCDLRVLSHSQSCIRYSWGRLCWLAPLMQLVVLVCLVMTINLPWRLIPPNAFSSRTAIICH